MASLSSPIGPTIGVVARTVSSSAISGGAGGGGGIPGGGGGGGRGGALAVQPQANLVNVERNLEVQTTQNVQQTQEISALRSAVDALRTETTTLNKGLVSISNLIQQDSAVEKQQEVEKAESERKLAETNVRLGKESQLEQRITNSLVTPVQALQQKVGNIFARIGEALTTLFFGWLTNQGIEALKAASEGNKEKLEEIKDNVLKGIGDAIKVFTAIKTGFNLVIKTITGITAKIAGFVTKLALAPIKALTNTLRGAPLLQNIFPGPKKPGGGGGGPGIFGLATGAIQAFMNAKNGEYVDVAMIALGAFGPGKIIKGLATLGFVLDDVIEVFGGNLFGFKNPNDERKAKEIVAEAKKQQKEQNPKEKSTTSTTSTTAAKVTSASTAQTPLMGNKKDEKSETDPKNMTPGPPGPVSGSANIQPTSDSGASITSAALDAKMLPSSAATTASTAPAEVQPQTPIIPPPSPEMTKNFQAAWDNRNRGYARGRIESAWNNMTVEQQQQAKEWAKSTGKDWTEMKLVEKPSTVQAVPLPSAQVQPLPKPTQNVGELTEPAPNVVMMPSGQSNNQQSSISQAPTNGTDTPLISSSNPDNFYVLYSQLNYNVVI
jgi:hypothetical protein